MSIDISELKEERVFENDKIIIAFTRGSVSEALTVRIKDSNGKRHHILWEISPDRSNQNFDKTNKKIKTFVKNKIDEWIFEQKEAEKARKEAIRKRELREENELKKLMDSF